MSNYGIYSLVILLSASFYVLLGNSSLGQINVPLVLVNPDDHQRLSPPHPAQLYDGPKQRV